MRWDFWNKQENVEVPETNEEEVEGNEGEEPEDDLADLDEETLTRVNAHIAKQTEAAEARLTQARTNLQQYGFDLTDDSNLSIRDPQRVQSHLSPLFPQQQNQATVAPSRGNEEETEEEWVSPDLDAEAFNKKLGKTIEAATKGYQDHIQRLEQTILADRIEDAVARVGEAVTKHLPLLNPVLEHPDFESTFREALTRLPMEQWRDPRALARIAGMLAPDLPVVEQPERRGLGRPPNAVRTTQETARAAANRVSLSQTAPSRAAGVTTAQEPRYSEDERHLAGLLGMTVEMWRSLEQDPNLQDGADPYTKYREVRDKERQTRQPVRPVVRRG